MDAGERGSNRSGTDERFDRHAELSPIGHWRRWLAHDRGERRTVIFSRLTLEGRLLRDEEFERARRRVAEAGRLRHPFLAPVVGTGVDAAGLWVAEDPGSGRPLNEPHARLPRGGKLAGALLGVLEAIAYLHRNGLAHGWVSRAALASDGQTLRLTGAALLVEAQSAGERSADVVAWARVVRKLLTEADEATAEMAVVLEAAEQVGEGVADAARLATGIRRALEMLAGGGEGGAAERTEGGATGDSDTMSRIRGFLGSFLLGLLTTVLTVGVIVGAVAGGVLLFLDRLPEEVPVPNVIGLSEADAIARLEDRGLRVGDVRRVYRKDIPVGEVAATKPEGGMTVRQGREITLVVSLGPAQVEVPRLIGLQMSEAKAVVEKAGLTVAEAGKMRSRAPLGEIVKQDPAPGTRVGRGKRVLVYVSGGPEFGMIEAETPDGETVRVYFRTLEIIVPVGDPLQRVVIREGYGDELKATYDRLHRPGDRIKFETYGREGKRIEVLIEGERVYRTQLLR